MAVSLGVSCMTASADSSPIVRKPLLSAPIDGGRTVDRVEIKEIEFSAHQKTGLHLHPCPVVGYIVEGTVTFQVEGQAIRTLRAGDAFYEPANTKILHFDANDAKVKFVAHYLLGKDESELIKMLP
jgi:quercetin dioxygenase-like cupin family protein